MTRFPHDQFAKGCFEPLLSTIGNVKPAKKVSAEVREIDIYFEPNPNAPTVGDLGLLQQCVSFSMATVLEPFRNAAAPYEIRACASKLYELHNDVARAAKRKKQRLPLPGTWPFLWIITPTLSRAVLEEFKAIRQELWPEGVYLAAVGWKVGFIVVHQLPVTPETLWFRLLGRNKVQAQAIAELQALPVEHPFRRPLIESLANLRVILEARKSNQPYERNLIMQLSPLYLEKIAAAEQRGEERGEQRGYLAMVLDMLIDKLGDLPINVLERLESLDLEQLRSLGKAMSGVESIDDLTKWLNSLGR